jgi:hypothetical protein
LLSTYNGKIGHYEIFCARDIVASSVLFPLFIVNAVDYLPQRHRSHQPKEDRVCPHRVMHFSYLSIDNCVPQVDTSPLKLIVKAA